MMIRHPFIFFLFVLTGIHIPGYSNAQAKLIVFANTNAISSTPEARLLVNGLDAGILKEGEYLEYPLSDSGNVRVDIYYPKMNRFAEAQIKGNSTLYLRLSYLLDEYKFLPEADGKRLSQGSGMKALSPTAALQRLGANPAPPKTGNTGTGNSNSLFSNRESIAFLVDAGGYLLTDADICQGTRSLMVSGFEGDFQSAFNADVIATDRQLGLALLRLKNPAVVRSAPPYSLSAGASHGDPVYTIFLASGNEIHCNETLTDTSYHAVTEFRVLNPKEALSFGGPVFDASGKVCGMAHRGNGLREESITNGESIALFLRHALPEGCSLTHAKNSLPLNGAAAQLKGNILKVSRP